MEGRHSRLLQVVVAAMLLNVAPDGRAETYDIEGVRATVPDDFWDDSAYFDAGYDNWEFDEYTERSVSDGEEPADEPVDEEKKAECDAIAAKVEGTCDLANPPILTTNGCGSGASTYVVPDYLMVNNLPVWRLGPIFLTACNMHDTCYGTYGNSKETCDMALHADMVDQARSLLTDLQWTFFGGYVRVQAFQYSAGLQAPFISYLAGNAFAEAQSDGKCRFYAGVSKNKGCID